MGITKKQKEVLDYITHYISQNDYAPTQKEIKEYFELKSFGSVQRYLKYLKEGGFLTQNWNAKRGLTVIPNEASSHPNENIELPLLGKVAAGIPLEEIDHPEETVSIPPSFLKGSGKHFALTVKGDSMIEDGILSGDTAIIKFQNQAQSGQTIVAVVEGEATLKKFYPKKNTIELHPANSTMKPFVYGPEDGQVQIAGILVGLLRVY
jgi:repressor LexA